MNILCASNFRDFCRISGITHRHNFIRIEYQHFRDVILSILGEM